MGKEAFTKRKEFLKGRQNRDIKKIMAKAHDMERHVVGPTERRRGR